MHKTRILAVGAALLFAAAMSAASFAPTPALAAVKGAKKAKKAEPKSATPCCSGPKAKRAARGPTEAEPVSGPRPAEPAGGPKRRAN